jgi:hypothetical protein
VRSDDKEESATIEVYKGSMHALGTTRRPSITFVIDRHSPTIFVTLQSISQGGGQGKFPLDEVTEEFVQVDAVAAERVSVPTSSCARISEIRCKLECRLKQALKESVSVGSHSGDVDFQSQRSIILGSLLADQRPTPECKLRASR